jgi:LAO/AO transport system kinase
VVTVPGLGDDIQALKAGILEVADVLAVNKADREGADRAVRDLMHMLELRDAEGGRREVEIVKTVAAWGLRDGSGIADLLSAIAAHRARVKDGPESQSRAEERAAAHVTELVKGILADRAASGLEQLGGMAEVARSVADRTVDPYTAAEEIASRV